jgi:phosphatidylglycerol:prolipoprotein diacylglycerol transferase
MLTYPQIDPVLLNLGVVQIHWYGMMYLIGFLAGWWLGIQRVNRPNPLMNKEQVGDLLFFIALGVVLGGRLGYVLFYDFATYIHNPIAIFQVWKGGMSFHGGLIGVIISIFFFARSTKHRFFKIADFIAPLVPPGIAAGRIGNFINGELWGKPTEMPWGMVFPHVDNMPRHPSQLYESALEGFALFIILWLFSSRPRPMMATSGLFLILYASFRFFLEFFREPDAHLGYLAFEWLTMGQLLTIPMVLLGILLITLAYRNQHTVT